MRIFFTIPATKHAFLCYIMYKWILMKKQKIRYYEPVSTLRLSISVMLLAAMQLAIVLAYLSKA